MTARIRTAIALVVLSLAGCELCQAMPPDLMQGCAAAFLNCDLDGDGDADGSGPCDAGQCSVGGATGTCV